MKIGKRRETRRLALELLARCDWGEEPRVLLEEAKLVNGEFDCDYLGVLFEGIINNRQQLDTQIKRFLRGWRLERLNRTDHAILLIASYELLFMQAQIPPKSAINEAVELAKKFGSSEKTPGFINAILDKIWHSVAKEAKQK